MKFLKRYQNLHKCRNEFADIRPFYCRWYVFSFILHCFSFSISFFYISFFLSFHCSNIFFLLDSCEALFYLCVRKRILTYFLPFAFSFLLLHLFVSQYYNQVLYAYHAIHIFIVVTYMSGCSYSLKLRT